MSIQFVAEIGRTRVLGEYAITAVKYQPENAKYPQFVDLKWKADAAPDMPEGAPVTVTMKYLPSARGWVSNKTNPNTGTPYVNANVVIYNPEVAVGEAPEGARPAEDFEDDIPF